MEKVIKVTQKYRNISSDTFVANNKALELFKILDRKRILVFVDFDTDPDGLKVTGNKNI